LRPPDWRRRLVALGNLFGKFPDEVAARPWSVLNDWWDAAHGQ
jgi:hypothetical protein